MDGGSQVKAASHKNVLNQGAQPNTNMADGDDLSLVPPNVSAAHGTLDCVKIFIEEVHLTPDT